MIVRSKIHWITEAGMFFEKQGPVWDALHALEDRLREADIPYVIIGGLALNAYNYPRQTVDVDVVLTPQDFETFRTRFVGSSYTRTPDLPRRFADADSEVTIDVLLAGELAGRRDRNHTVRFPAPTEGEVHGDLRTVSLARLIELKLVTWRFKDWGDVVELIRRNDLSADFGEQLDAAVRSAFGQCFDQANDAEYEGP
jgi:hypothetical protein